MTQYAIRRYHQKGITDTPLSEEDFQAGTSALARGVALLNIEEKYSGLLGNMEDLERNLLGLSLSLTIFTGEMDGRLVDARLLANRRVANLLSTARAYIDQVPQDLRKGLVDATAERGFFRASLSAHYDTHLAYRACEALRNYSQHNGLPVHGIGYSWSRDVENPSAPVAHRTTLALLPSRLDADGQFKATVRKELLDAGDSYDLKKALRQYVSYLSGTHLELRGRLGAHAETNEETIKKLIALGVSTNDPPQVGTPDLVAFVDDGGFVLAGNLHLRIFERRRALILRTRYPTNLERFEISSA